jgi:hypothetical protein
MAIQHLITKGLRAVSYLITQGLGAYSGEVVEPPAEEPAPIPLPQPFTGGVGGTRRELTDEERKELLRRVRKSLGLDKEEPAPDEGKLETEPARIEAVLSDLVADLVSLPADEEDDEIVLLLAAA